MPYVTAFLTDQSVFMAGMTHRETEKRRHILESATRLFGRKGYHNVSMAGLAKATGVATGTIFYHYTNKETLFLSILDRFQAELDAAFAAQAQNGDHRDGYEGLIRRVEFFFRTADRMQDEFLLLYRHDALDIADLNAACRQRLERIYEGIVGFFEAAVRIGQQDGSILAGSAPRTAMLIFTMIDGVLRCDTYGLYEAEALHDEFFKALSRMLRT